EAGGDAALRYVEVLVGGLEGLQRGHRAGIGVDARHGKYAPKQTGYWDIPGLSGLTGRHHAYGQLQRPTRHAWTCCTAAIPTKAIIGKGKLRRRNSGAPVHAKERTSEPTSRFQPSISTKNNILNGSDTTTGGSIIMPIDMVMVATIRSMTRKGSTIRKPISKPRLISEIMKAGTRMRKSASCADTSVWPRSRARSANRSKSLSRTFAAMKSRNGSEMRSKASASVISLAVRGRMPSFQAR